MIHLGSFMGYWPRFPSFHHSRHRSGSSAACAAWRYVKARHLGCWLWRKPPQGGAGWLISWMFVGYVTWNSSIMWDPQLETILLSPEMGVSYSTLQTRLVWFMAWRTHKTTNCYQAEPWFILLGKLAGNPGAKCQMAVACGSFSRGKDGWKFFTQARWKCLPSTHMGLSENRLNPYTQWVLLIIIPMKNGYFIGGIPHFQTYPYFVESILVHVNRLSTKNWWHVCILRLICLHTSTSRKIFTAMIKHLGYPGAPLHLETLIQSDKGGIKNS